MPQQHSRGGEDDGPPDETKTYHTEGEQEEKASENVVGPRDSFDHLNDVKSSLIDEGESVSQKGSSSQVHANSFRNYTPLFERPNLYVIYSTYVCHLHECLLIFSNCFMVFLTEK